jgi:ATP-dependent DNA ligase
VRLYRRPGNDLNYRVPQIVDTLARLRSRSCIIHGEAVGCDDNGVAVVNRVRYRHHDESIFLYAFDLIELNRDDLRPDSLEGRKATIEGLGQMTATSLNFALLDANRPGVARLIAAMVQVRDAVEHSMLMFCPSIQPYSFNP